MPQSEFAERQERIHLMGIGIVFTLLVGAALVVTRPYWQPHWDAVQSVAQPPVEKLK